MATLQIPDSVPSADEDCEQLRKAVEGWGTNESLVISILAHRNALQRKSIRETYNATYGEDLLKILDKELTSDFEKAVHLWTLDPPERDAYLANEAIRKKQSTDRVLIEIACTRSSECLLQARRAYHEKFKKSVEEDLAQHTTGDVRKLLVALVTAFRYEGPEVNTSLAKSEAKTLHQKIQDKQYGDDEVIRILTTRSKPQLSATLNHYNDDNGNPVNKDLKADPSDAFLILLRATTKCLTRPEKYFEKLLRLSINKMGTDETALTRVITTRAEVDLGRIREEYYRRNTVSLSHAIAGDTHGDYEDMILALLGEAES